MGKLPDMGGLLAVLGLICAATGWVVIELVLWVISHLTITIA